MSKPARFEYTFVGDDGPERLRVTLNGRELPTTTFPLQESQWKDERFRKQLHQMMVDVYESGRRAGKMEVQLGVRRELGL